MAGTFIGYIATISMICLCKKKCSFQLHMLQRLILKPYVNLIDKFISHSKQWTMSFSHTVNNPPKHSRNHCGFSLFPFYLSCSSTFHFTGIFTHFNVQRWRCHFHKSSRISHSILGIAFCRKGCISDMFQENVVQPLLVSTSAINMATETVLLSKDVGNLPKFTKVEKVWESNLQQKSNGHVHFGVFPRFPGFLEKIASCFFCYTER